ncbi:MAG TPA: heparan-alpha-glucosaminide N-acetyltransferase domain-containing protein [Vicinamibacterales bacterium]
MTRVSARKSYIDWARGLAVLIMIEAHTIDAWTRAADRRSASFGYLTILGGFAAPLFLWLAGLGVAMSAARVQMRTGRRLTAVECACRRGLEIFVLAFLFRLQAFVVSPGSHPVTLFRVDVLNIMGPAMVVAGILWSMSNRPGARVLVYTVVAGFLAMVTPLVRAAAWVEQLPTWIQWYLSPAGEYTTFTLLPWAGFVVAGAATGVIVGSAGDETHARRAPLMIGAAGVLVAAAGYAAAFQPSIYNVPSSFWTSSPTWFAMRVGLMMTALALLSAIPEREGWAFSWQRPLATLGRASLFVYWIHVELVYGYASWAWRLRLPVWASVLACILFSILMYGVVLARDRFVHGRPRRPVTFRNPATLSRA